MILLEKLKILTPLKKLSKNVGNLDKLIVAKGFEKLPKIKKITQSGHTVRRYLLWNRIRREICNLERLQALDVLRDIRYVWKKKELIHSLDREKDHSLDSRVVFVLDF